MKEQLKEFEFVWLFFKWIARQLIDWIARGVAVSAIGCFALIWPVMAIAWPITKIFDIDYDDGVVLRVCIMVSIALGGSLTWKVEEYIKQEKIDQTQKFLDNSREEARRLQRRVEELEK